MSLHDFTHTDASPLDDKRIILAHDYLIQMGGAERVMASLHQAFPQAPIYVSATDYARLLSEFHGLIFDAPVAGTLNIQKVGSDPIALTKTSFQAGSNANNVAVSRIPRISGLLLPRSISRRQRNKSVP